MDFGGWITDYLYTHCHFIYPSKPTQDDKMLLAKIWKLTNNKIFIYICVDGLVIIIKEKLNFNISI